ncbi:MAG: helix-turn-helix domain-containing protein [Balneolaceae bacterium]
MEVQNQKLVEKGVESWAFIAEQAYSTLEENIEMIRNVNDWASLTGCSRSWLWKCTKRYFGKTPNAILREVRFKKIVSVILENPKAPAKFVAGKVGPWNGARLYNFLNRYHFTNFTQLRYQVLNSPDKFL